MRLRNPPPRLASLFKETPPEALARVLALTGTRADVGGTYAHWEDLEHRAAPPGLSRRDWWFRLLLTRSATMLPLPLRDGETPFEIGNPDSIRSLIYTIDRDASGRIELPEPVANPATRDRYVTAGLMEEAITSSQLEGAATTRKVAEELLASGRVPRTEGERMILANFRAMEWVRAHQRERMTPALILELHRIAVRGTLPDQDAGRWRRTDENIVVVDHDHDEVVHTPPPAGQLPARMTAMCQFAAGQPDVGFIHPVVRAILLHFWLAFDHPFVDGNGRTARAIFYWQMLRDGYWLTEFVSISRYLNKARAQYAQAFVRSESTFDTTYFVLHQLQVIRRAIDDVLAYVKRKANEVRSIDLVLRDEPHVNRRQRHLLATAVRKPDSEFTIDGHRMANGVTYQTARTDLLDLVDRGWLVKYQDGRKFIFTPAHNLRARLER